LNEAWECDEAAGRSVGQQTADRDWYLWEVLTFYKGVSLYPLLEQGVARTGDDRVAANHVDGFALANEPHHAARTIKIGLAHAGEGVTLETWQPLERTAPVIKEDYLNEAVAEYERLIQADVGAPRVFTSSFSPD
jgi:hypothetical protein